MEGPSLVILKEELQKFTGRKVVESSGSAKVNHELLINQKIKAFKSWGKHFLIVFEEFSIRIHFLMFGSYRINEKKDAKTRLHISFENGEEINFYTTAVTIIDEDLDERYDWSTDVVNDAWDPK